MSSPFPGMDPYLEQPAIWPDFHDRFINCWSEAIADQLPAGYDVRIAERVYLTEPDEDSQRVVPDVSVGHYADPTPAASTDRLRSGAALTLEPVTLPLIELDPITERFIEVTTLPDRQIVAVLELLSPSNKSGRVRVEYLDKRDQIIKTNSHLLELDLLLGGRRLPLKGAFPVGDCFALVAHGERRPNCDVYAWILGSRLPPIPVPLRRPDVDLVIDLAGVFATAYQRGRYPRVLRYDRDPAVSLSSEQLAWARQIARSQPE